MNTPPLHVGSQVEAQKIYFMLKNRLKIVPEGLGRRFYCVLKTGLNIKGSWDRFSIDVGTISGALLGGPKATKHWPAWVRKHFGLFSAHLNISCLLGSKKYRFWVDFGSQVGHQNRTCWLQEGRLVYKKRVAKNVKKLKV